MLKLTGARARAGRLCRASASWTVGESRAAPGEESLQRESELLDSTDQRVVLL